MMRRPLRRETGSFLWSIVWFGPGVGYADHGGVALLLQLVGGFRGSVGHDDHPGGVVGGRVDGERLVVCDHVVWRRVAMRGRRGRSTRVRVILFGRGPRTFDAGFATQVPRLEFRNLAGVVGYYARPKC